MTSSIARPILERLAFVCYLVTLTSSIVITWLGGIVGFGTGDYSALIIALGGLALSRWLHVHGYAHWHFRQCEHSFDKPTALSRTESEEMRASEIASLIARLEAESNVWERGKLRKELTTKLAAAPGLRDDFAEELAAHPEI